jgi:RNA polymerase sigma-70 factor (ECF subfamily)
MNFGESQESAATLTAVSAEPADDEADLIAAAQRDPRAFGVFYDRYATRVYRYLRARTRSDDEAADLTQQVFLRALDALPRYRHGRTPFAAWLFRIARNSVIDSHRRRRPTIEWDLVPDTLRACEEWGPEERALRREELGRLQRLLLQLEPEKRDVVLLRFMAGLTAREVAAVLGKSEAAIHKQLSRTLHQLKEEYHVD